MKRKAWKESSPCTPYTGMRVRRQFRNPASRRLAWYNGVVAKLTHDPPGTILKFSIQYEDGDDEELTCEMLRKMRFEDKTLRVEHNFDMDGVVRPAAKKYALAKLAKEKAAVKSRNSDSTEFIHSATSGKGVCVTKNNVSEVFLLASGESACSDSSD
jgi:hypothetical protein